MVQRDPNLTPDVLFKAGRLPPIRGLSEAFSFDGDLPSERAQFVPVIQIGGELVTRLAPERLRELLRLPFEHHCNLEPEVDLVSLEYLLNEQNLIWRQSRFQAVYPRQSFKVLITDSTGSLNEFDRDGGYPPGDRIPRQMIYDRQRGQLLVGYDDLALFAVPEFDITLGSRRIIRRITAA